jgi:L-aminopeptidase/D-esterase-like protein
MPQHNLLPRAREAGLIIGELPTGLHNAITDVAGVRSGHATLISGGGAHSSTPPPAIWSGRPTVASAAIVCSFEFCSVDGLEDTATGGTLLCLVGRADWRHCASFRASGIIFIALRRRRRI